MQRKPDEGVEALVFAWQGDGHCCMGCSSTQIPFEQASRIKMGGVGWSGGCGWVFLIHE